MFLLISCVLTSTRFPYTTLFRSRSSTALLLTRLDSGVTRGPCRLKRLASLSPFDAPHPYRPRVASAAFHPYAASRSEDQTAELQSLYKHVCCLLLEKYKLKRGTA